MAPGELDIQMPKTETRSLQFSFYKTQLKMETFIEDKKTLTEKLKL